MSVLSPSQQCVAEQDLHLLDVSIVMPCLNEIISLPHCIANAQAALDRISAEYGLTGEIVIADNGSTDGSQALDDQRSTVRTYSVIADVCIVGAIAAGGYSAYKLISWKPNEKKGEAPKTNAFIAPTPTGGMVGVGGVF